MTGPEGGEKGGACEFFECALGLFLHGGGFFPEGLCDFRKRATLEIMKKQKAAVGLGKMINCLVEVGNRFGPVGTGFTGVVRSHELLAAVVGYFRTHG